MTDTSQPDPAEHPAEGDEPPRREEQQGPGCLPAVVAATVLMGIVGFIMCGVTTWMLYGKRTELAVRTLEQSFLPAVEQSRLEPEAKQAVLEQLDEFTADLKRGLHEDWQAAGVMQRLVRLPIIQWGQLDAVESYLRDQQPPNVDESLKQLSRLRRAVELGQATAVDVDDVLQPAVEPDESLLGNSLIEPLTDQAAAEVVKRAKTVADRGGVPDRRFEDVRIEAIVRRQIEAGLQEGTY